MLRIGSKLNSPRFGFTTEARENTEVFLANIASNRGSMQYSSFGDLFMRLGRLTLTDRFFLLYRR